ncbi:MAG TPA: HAD family phosphatase [Daejeonella sp.]|uniref:HAD family hydrolase n=1 Tax=Daejeonella sp. TaxID=2805397 RepID=UPI002ED86788
MNKIRNIIFDYGNVIFTIDFNRAQHSFTELGVKNVEHFFSHKGHDSLFDQFEQGLISSSEFRDGIRKVTGIESLSDAEIDQAWNSLLIGVPEPNHDLLLKVKEKYRTFLLSNNNEIHYNWIMDYLQREHRLDSNAVFFEKDYYSHLMKMRKPNREIFEFVMRENNLNPIETLFIDDSPQHLKTADMLGLNTHLLTADETLESYLYSSGLLKR